ncbi:conserved hypothetical protein [Ricinus communis]|uniref:Uncharacterized protein n=1 Tax=Ricinus communis TaxID=3988 RepID=B9SHI4_RICCO|nr:conserved hypothetical protein [Ricinus communis]
MLHESRHNKRSCKNQDNKPANATEHDETYASQSQSGHQEPTTNQHTIINNKGKKRATKSCQGARDENNIRTKVPRYLRGKFGRRSGGGIGGMGVRIDEDTGRTGSLNSEVVIDQGTTNNQYHANQWSFRYAMAERSKLQIRRPSSSIDSANIKKIIFSHEGQGSGDLGYTLPSDLQWQGQPACTTRQLDATHDWKTNS